MQCEWVYDETIKKFKCTHCGFVVPRASIKHRCSSGEAHSALEDMPSMGRRAVNFAKATANHLMTGRKHVSDEQRAERLSICQENQCGLFKKPEGSETGVCSHRTCGCFLRAGGKFFDKLSWADSKCPVGLWGEIKPESPENPENGV